VAGPIPHHHSGRGLPSLAWQTRRLMMMGGDAHSPVLLTGRSCDLQRRDDDRVWDAAPCS